MNTVASQLTKLWLIELRTVKVEEEGDAEEGDAVHTNSMGTGHFAHET